MCAAGSPSSDPGIPSDFRNGLRRQLHQALSAGLSPAGGALSAKPDPDGSRDPNTEALAEFVGVENLHRYESALQKLPVEYQRAIVARLELGFSYSQVAVSIGKPTAEDARATVCQALLRLAQQMSDEHA